MIGGLEGLQEIDDLRSFTLGRSDPAVAGQSRFMGVGGRPEVPLPRDASGTLFVEGLPANCTRREVSRILYIVYNELSYYSNLVCSFT